MASTWQLKFKGFTFSCRHDCNGKVNVKLVSPSPRDVVGGRASREDFDKAKEQMLAHWKRYGKVVRYYEAVQGQGV